MPEMHLRECLVTSDIYKGLVDHFLKTKKEHKHLKKQEIQHTFIKTN